MPTPIPVYCDDRVQRANKVRRVYTNPLDSKLALIGLLFNLGFTKAAYLVFFS